MTGFSELDRSFLEREYERLAGDLRHYYDSIVATERLALAGAAAVVAFLYTRLPVFALGQSAILAALPGAILAFAGLRCLTIYVLMRAISRYLRQVEDALLASPDFGFQRRVAQGSAPAAIALSTTAFWLLALLVAAYFWWIYEAPAAAI